MKKLIVDFVVALNIVGFTNTYSIKCDSDNVKAVFSVVTVGCNL